MSYSATRETATDMLFHTRSLVAARIAKDAKPAAVEVTELTLTPEEFDRAFAATEPADLYAEQVPA